MASHVVLSVKDLFEKYKKFVENNVETVGHLESAARILSYIVPGTVRSAYIFVCHILTRQIQYT